MKLTIKFTLFFFSILNFAICSGQFIGKEELRKADSVVNSYSRSDAPGMVIGIVRDGKTIYKKTYGLANLENKIPISDSTAFDIASVSK